MVKRMVKQEEKKRAITLGGGGPAAGLHIGVLEALADHNITFDVWALSCIGAWVGIVYNQFGDEVKNNDRAELTYQFFRNGVFRDDESYKGFPINTVFGPDWRSNIKALNNFVSDRDNYKDFLWDPYRMMDVFQETMELLFNQLPKQPPKFKEMGEGDVNRMITNFMELLFNRPPKFKRLDEGDVNRWILNQAMATNPFVRYFTSMMYLSNVNGLSRINYPDSEFMRTINFEELKKEGKPHIFHNAWNLDEQKLALFSNHKMKAEGKYEYKGPINASTLCACSALPFIEGTVEIDGVTYCEGALVDTVNFESLLEEHPDLDEIWVSRIVDSKQIRKPENLHDALANLCQLFAATVGEDDVKLFKYHVRYEKKYNTRRLTIVEIHVPGHINFKWNHSNLENGRELGRAAGRQAFKAYNEQAKHKKADEPHFINEDLPKEKDNEEWQELDAKYEECVKRADPAAAQRLARLRRRPRPQGREAAR